MANKVELEDVQGIIIKGYGKMPYAAYLLIHFNEKTKAKSWLGGLTDKVTNATLSTKDDSVKHAINIAFTKKGLCALGLDDAVMNTFSREFDEGMVTPHRQRILGDFGESDPQNWEWGGRHEEKEIDAVLLLYAKSKDGLDSLIQAQEKSFAEHSISLLNTLDTLTLYQNKEHFGFRDGIAQPVMKDAGRREDKEHPANLINPGEFIFGYKNEYDKYPFSPNVPSQMDGQDVLTPDATTEGRKDLGRNGSMLVFRQMEQDVHAFWEFMQKAVEEQKVDNTSNTMEALAAKMVGRWTNGSPLTKCPLEPNDNYKTFDNFGYAENDFDGFKCPVGAHIRRANPRDNFLRNSSNSKEKDMEKSQKFMKRFRILRRGRSYGEPVSPTLDPEEVLRTPKKDVNRGLHFLCFNVNIGRQFELMQQTWINNPKFAGLYEDPDPIIGYPEIMGEGATTTFTEQAQPIRKKITGIPRFVQVKGGAYFFMPSIKALKFLSSFSS